jgi:hypothetical protein
MKSIFKTMLLATTASAVLFSCTDLEEDLVGDITEAVSVTAPSLGGDAGGAGDALAGAYAQLQWSGTANHFSYFSVQGLPSDEMAIAAKGGDWYDGGVLIEMHEHNYTPTNGMIGNAWGGQYGAIGAINDAIANLGLSPQEINQMRALRAYFYWRMLDLYGGVKIVTAPGQEVAQSTRQQVYDFVESELLAALGTTEISANTVFQDTGLQESFGTTYRINRYGALGILAKLYLNHDVYNGDTAADAATFTKAAQAAKIIMDSGRYSLCETADCDVVNLGRRPAVSSDPERLAGYAAVFAANNDQNREHIFAVGYDEATAGGMNFAKMTLHYSSQLTWNFEAQPWNGYAALEEFYNSYDSNDLRKANNFIVGPQLDYGGNALNDFAADDAGGIQLDYTPAINELQPNSLREAGARLGKFSFKQFGRPDQSNDFPIVRYGDVILMYAEATARAAGDWNNATTRGVVEQIRSRAGLSSTPAINADFFLAERGREMFQESSRRTDLIRFGKYGEAWWNKPASADHKTLMPIPFDAVNNNGFTQNPGY